MNNLEEIKKRFLKNNLAVRLGCIAADLARLNSFLQVSNNQKVIKDLIEESKFFIEWTAPKASPDLQEELVNLQIQLALWGYSGWGYSGKRKEIARLAQNWSKKILKLSGLIKED